MADANNLTNPLEEEEVVTPPEELEPEELEEIEEPEVEEPEADPVEEEPEEEEPAPISRREQLRVQDLLSRKKSEEPSPKPRRRADRLNYEEEFQVDPEDAKRLEADRRANEDYMYQQGLEQVKSIQFHTRLEVDAPRVATRYPILDKHNEEQFHPGLANAINTMYLSTVGFDKDNDTVQNADLRYEDFTDALFELADEIAKSMTANTTQAVKAQAAKTGLRPDGSSAKRLDLNKAPKDMTDEELEAYIKANLG